MKILITGTAGFIGFHLVRKLVTEGHQVIGLDNINAYYDVQLKLDRLKETGISSGAIWYNKLLKSNVYDNYQFIQLNLEDAQHLAELFQEHNFDAVCHLAAQAGVRYSIDNPQTYIDSNIVGFFNILECCRNHAIKHLVYASSSSVYGNSTKVPFEESDRTDEPISLYAATKKTNELMAYTYSHLYGMHVTGLRFFTVYGPWGRPDMAYFKFTKAIVEGSPIQVYNEGNLSRDFTYIDDIVEGITRILQKEPTLAFQILNIGNHAPARLLDFIETLESVLQKKANKIMLPMQPGDVITTFACTEAIKEVIGFSPNTPLSEGLSHFAKWYRAYKL